MNLKKSNKTTSYLIKKIPKSNWNKFKGYALLSGYNSVGDLLREIIVSWRGKND